MADVIIVVSLSQESPRNPVMLDTTNPRRPFYKGFTQACDEFELDDLFASGDNVTFRFLDTTKIFYADVKEDAGSGVFNTKAYTEDQPNAPDAGHDITCANCIGNLKVNIYGDVR